MQQGSLNRIDQCSANLRVSKLLASLRPQRQPLALSTSSGSSSLVGTPKRNSEMNPNRHRGSIYLASVARERAWLMTRKNLATSQRTVQALEPPSEPRASFRRTSTLSPPETEGLMMLWQPILHAPPQFPPSIAAAAWTWTWTWTWTWLHTVQSIG